MAVLGHVSIQVPQDFSEAIESGKGIGWESVASTWFHMKLGKY